jgi:hypothetical protein
MQSERSIARRSCAQVDQADFEQAPVPGRAFTPSAFPDHPSASNLAAYVGLTTGLRVLSAKCFDIERRNQTAYQAF